MHRGCTLSPKVIAELWRGAVPKHVIASPTGKHHATQRCGVVIPALATLLALRTEATAAVSAAVARTTVGAAPMACVSR
eukprot:scaffold329953_cov53-Tisochrysis_lutea.AAC.4